MAGSAQENFTVGITEFILLGFGNLRDLQIFLFATCLVIYLVTVTGNLLILTVVIADGGLHTPMYFFLSNLSLLEICYTSTVAPKMLRIFLTPRETIPFAGCLAQLYIFGSMTVTECCLLSIMSYDRYVAICQPLRYAAMMNINVCLQLTAGCWVTGFLAPLATVVWTSRLLFCASNEVDHFVCDFVPLLKLLCADTHAVQSLSFIICACVGLLPFLLTLTSYYKIILTVSRIPSTMGKQKTFSTCSSHLLVVSIFYGTVILVYGAPVGNHSPEINKVFSVLYAVVSPMFNPIIYRLRNKEVRDALRRVTRKAASLLKGGTVQ
nr:olfactory receptor 10A7-like [Pelodiscus sinensis]|eukprot:XP_006122814.1 olfactory receptor 10A7-like [Pelodiscus sinensis]